MSRVKRAVLIGFTTFLVAIQSYYILKNVIPREDYNVIDSVTVGFTMLAILKTIQMIAMEVKQNVRK